ncbi:acyltransferase [Variovorax dokdonensis]|uniref:Acyltransferase n=1 Tax=Variovorax dokdonensis TaxID=344883 RepID=A0ABT7N5V8_9BURK|nr:acyltransferase [Variovorax dokdonensis]MDM0043334.1 acyltransferase [Variovorax dokdonensis]
MTHASTSRLLSLDGMRGLAAIAVIAWHLEFIGAFAQSGYLAVDFFFVMSGVVIARAYRQRLHNGLPTFDFFAERVIRLYPLYLLGLLIGLTRLTGQIVAGHPNSLSWSELGISAAFNLLMLPTPATTFLAPINIPSWSLFFELLVNVFWAAVLLRASRRVLIAAVVFLYAALSLAVMDAGSAQGGWIWSEFHVGLLRSLFGFLLGVLMAQTIDASPPRKSWWTLVAAAALCALLAADVPQPYRPLFDLGVILVASPAIVWVGMRFDPPACCEAAARALGDMSFPVYVLHFGPLFSISFLARKLDISPALWIPSFVLGICAVSLYLARTYDPWARGKLKRLLAGRRLRMTWVA